MVPASWSGYGPASITRPFGRDCPTAGDGSWEHPDPTPGEYAAAASDAMFGPDHAEIRRKWR